MLQKGMSRACSMTMICSICALAAHNGWNVHQLDIKTISLNGDFHEEVYVSQPRGFIKKGQEKKVCRLKNALYGFKQASCAWYEKKHEYLAAHGFCSSPNWEYTLCEENMWCIFGHRFVR